VVHFFVLNLRFFFLVCFLLIEKRSRDAHVLKRNRIITVLAESLGELGWKR
jgi:hypothetical protein